MSYNYSEPDPRQLKKEIRRIEKLLKRGRVTPTEREMLEEDLAILREDLDYVMEYV
jgi:hypothetical protein